MAMQCEKRCVCWLGGKESGAGCGYENIDFDIDFDLDFVSCFLMLKNDL